MFRVYGKIYSLLKASFSYGSRASRGDFWFYCLFFCTMFFAALGADITYFVLAKPTGFFLHLQALFGGRPPMTYCYLILFFPAFAAITIRRLHDRGHTGWWSILYLIPFIGQIIMVAMLARQGVYGANAYGPDPRLQSASASSWSYRGLVLSGWHRLQAWTGYSIVPSMAKQEDPHAPEETFVPAE